MRVGSGRRMKAVQETKRQGDIQRACLLGGSRVEGKSRKT